MNRFRVLYMFLTVILIACHGGTNGLERSPLKQRLGVRIPATTTLSPYNR